MSGENIVTQPRVYADFHNADSEGRLRLNCSGTSQDLVQQEVSLQEGLVLTLYSDDADEDGNTDELEVTGIVEYSEKEQCWVARIDWNAIQNASQAGLRNGASKRSKLPLTHD